MAHQDFRPARRLERLRPCSRLPPSSFAESSPKYPDEMAARGNAFIAGKYNLPAVPKTGSYISWRDARVRLLTELGVMLCWRILYSSPR